MTFLGLPYLQLDTLPFQRTPYNFEYRASLEHSLLILSSTERDYVCILVPSTKLGHNHEKVFSFCDFRKEFYVIFGLILKAPGHNNVYFAIQKAAY